MAELPDWAEDVPELPEWAEEAPEAASEDTPQPKRGTAAATLRALADTPLFAAGGRLLEATGALRPGVRRAGAPEVGPVETALNKAVNAVPAGGFLTDVGSTAATLASRAAGAVLPDSAVRGFSAVPGLGMLAPVAGPGAVLTPEARKALQAMGEDVDEPSQPGLLDTYRRLRGVRRARMEAGEEQNPLASVLGTAGGLGLSLLAPLPKATPRGAGTGAAISAGAKTGAGYGLLAGLTGGEADLAGGDFTGAAGEAGLGLVGGGLLGGLVPGVAGVGRGLIRGVVQPTQAARELEAQGVRGLTLGQRDPQSSIGILESANRQVPGFGAAIAGQREVAQSSARIAALNQARPPGMPEIPQNTPIPDAMRALQRRFDRVYREIDAAPVPTASADRMLTAISSPRVRAQASATPAAIRRAENVIQNQMGLLPPAGTTVPAGLLRTIRSNIRSAIRKHISSSDTDQIAAGILLQEAERGLTRGISDALPSRLARRLRTADQRYGQYKILEDAVLKAKDPVSGMGEFTPQRLVTSVQQAAQNRGSVPDYVGGGGGPLRRLAASAIQSFQDVPPTGRVALLSGGWPGRYVAAPLLYLGNRPGVQPYALGEAPIQQSLQRTSAALAPYLSRLNPPQSVLPQAIVEALRNSQENQ